MGGGLAKPGLVKQIGLKRGDGCLERMWFSRRHVVLVGILFSKRYMVAYSCLETVWLFGKKARGEGYPTRFWISRQDMVVWKEQRGWV